MTFVEDFLGVGKYERKRLWMWWKSGVLTLFLDGVVVVGGGGRWSKLVVAVVHGGSGEVKVGCWKRERGGVSVSGSGRESGSQSNKGCFCLCLFMLF
ncbi:hypothetical protein HanPI659440_Chr13g0512281 [Helianthus annuus]|nr:hypothetical protein HanPI659440_Chr13g0512281 [Helianthus annuus]